MKRRMKNQEKRHVLGCRSCGWKWAPDPKKWRNNWNTNDQRALHCPKCGTVNRVRFDDMKLILKLNF
jgi:predicted RNA-binding Zn-ribbon protein involved in translation (DUF1610 family)